MLAAVAQLAIVFAGHIAFPYLRDALLGPAYGLVLPQIAVLHTLHAPRAASGAVLGTLAGAAHVAIGLAAALVIDLQPVALFLLGMWWWTIGKMWAADGPLPRRLGSATMAAGALALVASVVAATNAPLTGVLPGLPDVFAWDVSRVALALWLVAVAVPLARTRGTGTSR